MNQDAYLLFRGIIFLLSEPERKHWMNYVPAKESVNSHGIQKVITLKGIKSIDADVHIDAYLHYLQ